MAACCIRICAVCIEQGGDKVVLKFIVIVMSLIPCIFLQLIHQPTNELNKTQFMTDIKFLHVWAPGCHPQGVS